MESPRTLRHETRGLQTGTQNLLLAHPRLTRRLHCVRTIPRMARSCRPTLPTTVIVIFLKCTSWIQHGLLPMELCRHRLRKTIPTNQDDFLVWKEVPAFDRCSILYYHDIVTRGTLVW